MSRISIRTHGVGFLSREPKIETLDLHGVDAVEAESRIDRFVNDAIMRGVERVKILHGNGKGVIKRTVEEYCDRHKGLVESRRSFGPGYELDLLDIGHRARR